MPVGAASQSTTFGTKPCLQLILFVLAIPTRENQGCTTVLQNEMGKMLHDWCFAGATHGEVANRNGGNVDLATLAQSKVVQ